MNQASSFFQQLRIRGFYLYSVCTKFSKKSYQSEAMALLCLVSLHFI